MNVKFKTMLIILFLMSFVLYLHRNFFGKSCNKVKIVDIYCYDTDEEIYLCSFLWNGKEYQGFIIEADYEMKKGVVVGYDATLKRWHVKQKKS